MNDGMTEATRLIVEHMQGERTIENLNREASPHYSRLAEIEAQLKAIELRQDQIVDALAPALLYGPVEVLIDKTKHVVRLDGDDSITVEPLRPTSTLAVAMRPRMFSNAMLKEAARYQAFSDLDDDDNCEIFSLPGRRVTIRNGDAG
jgi:hypothetical protein